jgi:5-methylcytosine-specific restriction endonuclease McrA
MPRPPIPVHVAEAIIADYRAGYRNQEIAKRNGVCRAMVQKHLRRTGEPIRPLIPIVHPKPSADEIERRKQVNRDRAHAWQAANPERHRETRRKFSENNRELVRRRNRLRMQALRKKSYEYYRDLSARNQASYRARFPDRVKGWMKAWREANPEKCAEHTHRRRAQKLSTSIGTDRDAYRSWVRLLKTEPSLACYWCGKRTKPKGREIDHIVPLSRGGADDVYNLCASCRKCNRSKHAKMPHKFSGQHVIVFPSAV